ncbi:PREDICTED: polyhomeotic-proximal chromatin protein isoform X3 [Rhagoletis zephyria]|uniref:polyhomeotic-proximal chromatin protein isoform X3 n=1 Tax=Rhagoletis zephyria TaxID=28612 RepID=UPI00081128AE|nr:PREDICTED: polyhomeotic-proximal chromatin protein isoform X3 [Rhagoletis zephyria]
MESNTQTAEVKQTPESNAVVEVPSEKVEIEDCSDDSEQNGVTAVVQLTAKRSKEAAEETETKVEVTAEKVEVESDEEEEDESDSSDVAETLEIIKKPKSAADVEESKKQSSIPNYNQNDNSIGIIVTTTPPTPTTTTPTVAEVTEQQQEKGMKESRVIEVDAEQKEIAEKGKGGGVVAQVTNEIKKEQVTVDSDEAEIKPQQSENAVELAALQAEISTTQVETTQTPIKAAEPKQQPQAQLEVNSNDTIKDIKSDISSNIEQENIATLKRQQKELLEKQQELAQQIRQQQLIAQQLACENRLHQQQLEQQKQQQQSQQEIPRIQTPYKHQPTLTPYQPQENISKYSTIEETKDEHGFTRKTETYESKESSNATKHIDLRKIFTPASDTEEILPRNRAELFAKRRRKSEKWVVDETNTGTQSPSGLPDYHQHQQVKPPTSPSILPAYSDAGKHRVQLNLHQEQVLEKYVKPGLKVIKTPWEAALETGSASSAFVEDVKLTPHHTPTPTLSPKPAPQYQFAGSTVPDAVSYNDGYTTDYNITPSHKLHEACFPTCKPNFSSNPQRDLAYKPSLPQGWKAPSVTLPKELYLPKEISLESYAPPPVVNIKQPEAYNKPSWKFTPTPSPVPSISFPLAKPNSGGGVGFLSYGATPPPKQQYYEPTSYRTVPQSTTPNVTQISYNPSPLSYEKIAKFENVAEQQLETNDWNSQPRRLGIQSQGANVRNASPAQFGERSGSAGDHLSSSSSPYQTHNVPRNDIYERATTPIYTKRQNINKLLHGQNYNNTARGWRASSSASSVGSYPKACGGAYNTGLGAGGYGGGYQQKPLATANDLPYTDF